MENELQEHLEIARGSFAGNFAKRVPQSRASCRFCLPFVGQQELVRDVLECGAEQILCVRSGPRGDDHLTLQDVEDACHLKHALWRIEVPPVEYIIVGDSVTSLVQLR